MRNLSSAEKRRGAKRPSGFSGSLRTMVACLLAALFFTGTALCQDAWTEQSAPLPEGSETHAAQTESTTPPPVVLEDAEGYPVMALLIIDALSLELPVIAEVSDTALKVAPCLYAGPSSPAYPGNIVITGHNYRNESHFGRLDELNEGDLVRLMDVFGEIFLYEVYDILTIGPEDIAVLEEYEGEYGLALVTCADKGKNRLLVKCRVSAP